MKYLGSSVRVRIRGELSTLSYPEEPVLKVGLPATEVY
jgi:hypothetical protein